jgi:hypothetical protein
MNVVPTKAELLSQLENAKNNYILGLAALSLFATPQVYPILEQQSATFGPYTVQFRHVAGLLANIADRDIAVKEFLLMLVRALIKEPFELVKDHSAKTGQNAALKAESWYQFGRMIRNALSHNFTFEFNKYDKGLLPESWRTRTLTVAMDQQPLALSFFGYVEAWELFQEFADFARNRLT